MKLAPCPSCARHVRVDEAACPFCQSVFAQPLVHVVTTPKISRVIAIAMTATLAGAGLEGCVPGPQPLYGAPPPQDSGTVEEDAGGGAAEYGAPPPVDAGAADVDAGNGSADYGAPPPP